MSFHGNISIVNLAYVHLINNLKSILGLYKNPWTTNQSTQMPPIREIQNIKTLQNSIIIGNGGNQYLKETYKVTTEM